MDIIARIQHKLAYLQTHDDGDVRDAAHDRAWQIRTHYPYNVTTRHTEEEIAAFEAQHGIRLPEDYRRFIVEVGSEGFNAGYTMHSPLHGMLTGNEMTEFFNRLYSENDFDEEELWKEDAPYFGDLNRPFHFSDTVTGDTIEQFKRDASEDDSHLYLDGFLPIVDSGCTCWYILVVSGEARGQIWYNDCSLFTPIILTDGKLSYHTSTHDTNTLPPFSGQRVNFTQWYDAFLNEQIAIAQAHWHKRGRVVPPLALD